MATRVDGQTPPPPSAPNSPAMRDFENRVAAAVRGGETVNYSVTPIYEGAQLIPRGVTITARGSSNLDVAVTILNRQ